MEKARKTGKLRMEEAIEEDILRMALTKELEREKVKKDYYFFSKLCIMPLVIGFFKSISQRSPQATAWLEATKMLQSIYLIFDD